MSQQPALTAANDTMIAMLAEAFNWKFNRAPIPPFLFNSWQQDYAIVVGGNGGSSLTTIAWLEHGVCIDVNNSALPKPIWPIEAVRDLEMTSNQYGRPGQVCWLPNDQLYWGTWGGANVSFSVFSNGNNPQPNQPIVNPLGQPGAPANPILQIKDPNGNFLTLTQFGTTGPVPPSFPGAGAAPGIQVSDGSCVWTVVDPKGQGFRINPIPPQSGNVYGAVLFGQNRPPMFTKLGQTIDPIPDDYAKYFRQGFVAHIYRHAVDARISAKFEGAKENWIMEMKEARSSGDRERDSAGFYPTRGLMDTPWNNYVGPANPYFPGW